MAKMFTVQSNLSIALVDGGSFVVPYDFELLTALEEGGAHLSYFCSNTRFNEDYLDSIKGGKKRTVVSRDISSSTGRNIFVRSINYVLLLIGILRKSSQFDIIILEFPALWLADLIFVAVLRKKVVFLVHNAVPHEVQAGGYFPYDVISRLSAEVWCVSDATAKIFTQIYPHSNDKIRVVQHGLLGAGPHSKRQKYTLPVKFESVVFWGLVKPYKGVGRLLEAVRENQLVATYVSIEVHGKWSKELLELKKQFVSAGAIIEDRYILNQEVESLLSRNVVIVLPYLSASQSGILYTLLNHGCYFIAADVGDIGAFLRRNGLDCLLLDSYSLSAIEEKSDWIVSNGESVRERLQNAADNCSWDSASHAVVEFSRGISH